MVFPLWCTGGQFMIIEGEAIVGDLWQAIGSTDHSHRGMLRIPTQQMLKNRKYYYCPTTQQWPKNLKESLNMDFGTTICGAFEVDKYWEAFEEENWKIHLGLKKYGENMSILRIDKLIWEDTLEKEKCGELTCESGSNYANSLEGPIPW